MTDLNALVTKLKGLGLNDSRIEHAPVADNLAWAKELATASGLPSNYVLTKTLVFKPKQPKSDPIAPVFVVIKDDKKADAKAIGNELKLKDLRLASDSVLSDIFQTAKGS
ncbi:hypothetical protein GGF43_006760, partial [Coemansia sp. RSA 2618]